VLDLPSAPELSADAAARAAARAAAQLAPAAVGGGGGGAAPLPQAPQAAAAEPPPDAAQTDSRPLFLEHLEASRLFHCPDAVDAMAEAYGAAGAFEGLQASLTREISHPQSALRARVSALVEDECPRLHSYTLQSRIDMLWRLHSYMLDHDSLPQI